LSLREEDEQKEVFKHLLKRRENIMIQRLLLIIGLLILTACGNKGEDIVKDTTPPATPTNLRTIGGDQQITLEWQANAEVPFVLGYRWQCA
jgi:hypothetical protein